MAVYDFNSLTGEQLKTLESEGFQAITDGDSGKVYVGETEKEIQEEMGRDRKRLFIDDLKRRVNQEDKHIRIKHLKEENQRLYGMSRGPNYKDVERKHQENLDLIGKLEGVL